jgi:hypothetical protein
MRTKTIAARELSIKDRLVEKHGRRRLGMPLSEVHVDELVVTARVRIEHGQRATETEPRGPWMPTDRLRVVA